MVGNGMIDKIGPVTGITIAGHHEGRRPISPSQSTGAVMTGSTGIMHLVVCQADRDAAGSSRRCRMTCVTIAGSLNPIEVISDAVIGKIRTMALHTIPGPDQGATTRGGNIA